MAALPDYLPLFAFVAISAITPGGATTMATASGAHFGYRRSLPYITGIAAGLASMAVSTAAGLGTIVQALPILQLGMKVIGSLYLLWLASRIGRSGSPRQRATIHKPVGFVGAVWMLWHNPKGWTMTLGAAASFATLTAGPMQLATLLGVSFGLAAIVSMSTWCLAGLLFARLLRSETQWRVLNATLALLLALSVAAMWVS